MVDAFEGRGKRSREAIEVGRPVEHRERARARAGAGGRRAVGETFGIALVEPDEGGAQASAAKTST